MRRLLILLICLPMAAWAVSFPALTGRVVDDAGVLSAPAHQQLEQLLADYENGTGHQLVVATVKSLEGLPVEDYAIQLARQWKLGRKDADDGVLLLVAPSDRRVRIEVGYGLEGSLTDAQSSQIIRYVILPAFKQNHMEEGVISGAQAIIATLGGKPAPSGPQHASGWEWLFFMLFLWIFLRLAWRHPFLAALMLSGNSSRFGSGGFGGGSSFGGGGGFSGGGGGFGGGGASGSW